MRHRKPINVQARLPLGLSPALLGALCCLVAVFYYTLANICMRHLAYVGCDGTWAICNREVVCFTLVGCWIIYRTLAGKMERPPLKPLVILISAGLFAQLVGNTGMQWALGIAGLGFMVSSNAGFSLIAGAILGYLLLRETIGPRHVASIGMLLLAVVMLWMGARTVGGSPGASAATVAASSGSSALLLAVSVSIAAIAGVCYALQNISIRYCVTQGTPISIIMVIITGTGVFTFGPWCLLGSHAAPLATTPASCYPWMYAAGVANFIGFLSIIRGLKYTTVTHVNTISAMQVALAAMAGIVFFGEQASLMLLAGVGMMIAGVVYFGAPEAKRVEIPEPESVMIADEQVVAEQAELAEALAT